MVCKHNAKCVLNNVITIVKSKEMLMIKKRKTDNNFIIFCNIRTRTNKAFKSQKIRKTKKTKDILECFNSFSRKRIIHRLYGDRSIKILWFSMDYRSLSSSLEN